MGVIRWARGKLRYVVGYYQYAEKPFATMSLLFNGFVVVLFGFWYLFHLFSWKVVQMKVMFPNSYPSPSTDRIQVYNVTEYIKDWAPFPGNFTPYWKTPPFEVIGLAQQCNRTYYRQRQKVNQRIGKMYNVHCFSDGTWLTDKKLFTPKVHRWMFPRKKDHNRKKSRIRFANPSQMIEKGYFAVHLYNRGYFHFLIELFPIIWRLYHDRNPENVVVVFSKNQPFITNQVLEFFNMSSLKYVQFSTNDSVFVKELYMTEPRKLLQIDDVSLSMLRDLYLRTRFHPTGKRRYMYQKHFRNRAVNGYETLLAEIHRKYDFIDFEIPIAISLEHQVHMYQDCLIIMGPHGGAFANVMWMPTNAVVIEFTNSYCHSAIFDVAMIIGMKYYVTRFPGAESHRDTVCDIALVMSIIDKAVVHLRQVGLL